LRDKGDWQTYEIDSLLCGHTDKQRLMIGHETIGVFSWVIPHTKGE
jgi:hypothetical protein